MPVRGGGCSVVPQVGPWGPCRLEDSKRKLRYWYWKLEIGNTLPNVTAIIQTIYMYNDNDNGIYIVNHHTVTADFKIILEVQ